MIKNIFRRLFKNKEGQRGLAAILVLIGGAIVTLIVVAVLPPINEAVMGGAWTIPTARVEVNDGGYTADDGAGSVYVDDVIPNADSTYTVGDLANEFSEAHFDDLYLLGSYVGTAGISDLFLDCIVITAQHVRAGEDLSAGLPITFTLTLQPDVPRTLSGHFVAHANITAYTITVTGINSRGDAVNEVLTDADGWDWETNWAYAKITSIIMSARTGGGVGDTMDIGITDVLGLSNNVNLAADVYKIKKNNTDEAVVAGDVNVTYDTYDMATAVIGAADDFTIWYNGNISYAD